MNNIKIICKGCNVEMLPESTSDNNKIIIYLCKVCKHEVKVISIRNEGVSGGDRTASYKKAIDTDDTDNYHNVHGR